MTAGANVLAAAPSRRRWTSGGFGFLPATAVLVSLIALLPLGFIVFIAIQTGWDQVVALVFRPRIGDLLVNTLLLEILAVPAAIALAIALAWLTERTDLPGARLFGWLAIAPLAIPAFVHGYAWVGLYPAMDGLGPAVLLSVLAYFPFAYLPVAAQLRRLDPSLENAAAALGASPWRVFRRVVLPQLRIAICGGALLIGLHLLAEYGLLALIRYDTFTTAIVDQFQSSFNGPAANMMAGVLVICCAGLLLIEALARGRERYARIGAGAPRHPVRRSLGRWRWAATALPVATALVSLGVPLATLGRWLVLGWPDRWDLGAVGGAFLQTAGYAAAAALITVAAAFPMAWLSVRRPGGLSRLLEACHYYVGAIPGVVVGLALVTITVRVALPLYQTAFTILLAYALLFLPRAMVGLRAGVAQAPIELERAAMSLGRPPLRAIMATTMRLAAPGAAAAAALVAMGVATELTATLMLAPTGTRMLATEFWAFTSEIDYVGAAPYAIAMVVLSLPLTFLLNRQARRAAGL
ncbi:MAG: iron ABC transporter permease [Bauldia sp.]|nr:iron ABC transporter permease [Bauldia sp.]